MSIKSNPMGKDIIEALNWRYAVKKFDPERKVSEDDLNIIKESLRLAPSSYGLQPLKFWLISDKKIREKLVSASWGQRQVADASHLIVICAKTDITDSYIDQYVGLISKTREIDKEKLKGFGDFVKTTIGKLSKEEIKTWNSKQAYIVLGQILHTLSLLKIDGTPMEGFSPEEYQKILDIPQEYTPVVLCPIGYRHKDDANRLLKKVRKPTGDLFVEI